jgi:regulator of RNase E activity RraA
VADALGDALAERLTRLDACAVSDALDRLGLAGAVVGLASMSVTQRIAGRVVTTKLVMAADAPPATSGPRHLGTTAIETAQAGDVIVIEHRGPEQAAGWGGILSTAAHAKGVVGVIVDGAVRDVDEARELPFPVYARRATPMTARGRLAEATCGEPIEVGGLPVAPGDLVLADGSGVVFIAAAMAEQVLDAAEAIAEREAAMARDVRAGMPVTVVMGASYEGMLER